MKIWASHDLDALGLLMGEGRSGAVIGAARLGEERVPPMCVVAIGRGAAEAEVGIEADVGMIAGSPEGASRLARLGLVTVGSRNEKKLCDSECLCYERPITSPNIATMSFCFPVVQGEP